MVVLVKEVPLAELKKTTLKHVIKTKGLLQCVILL
jgi:hypothetical protein